MVRMLHIVGNIAPGGMGNFLMNIYRNLNRDEIQFDFIVMGVKPVNYHAEIEEMGGKVYQIPRISKHPIQYFHAIKRIVKENQYKIVFRHTANASVAIDLLAAKLGGATTRIPHAHSTTDPKSTAHRLFRPFLVKWSTERFACSQNAGKWMYGDADFKVIKNGIDLQRFTYKEQIRQEKRAELNLAEKHVYGHVGNFFYPKNHDFLIDIFQKISIQDENTVLLLVGNGELREEIEQKVRTKNLEDKVQFLGTRSDIPELMMAMDELIFPSVYEGLPITLVEAQATGLSCLISDVITDEVTLTDLIHKESLPTVAFSKEMVSEDIIQQAAKRWAERAIDIVQSQQHRITKAEESILLVKQAGYTKQELVNIYSSISKNT